VKLTERVKRLEREMPTTEADDCHCEMVAGVSGWRTIYGDDGTGQGPHGDYVKMCLKCGQERPVFRVVYGNDENKGA